MAAPPPGDAGTTRGRPFTTAFLDRDGTLNVKPPEGEYVTRAEDLEPLPGALRAVRRLNEAGVYVVLVSNQRGIARGKLTAGDLRAVTGRLLLLLGQAGARLDAIYICPHAAGACDCRKPAPGMLLRAAREHVRVDLARAVMIGDSESDIAAGAAAGTATVRIGRPPLNSAADYLTSDLGRAVDWVLGARHPAVLPSHPR